MDTNCPISGTNFFMLILTITIRNSTGNRVFYSVPVAVGKNEVWHRWKVNRRTCFCRIRKSKLILHELKFDKYWGNCILTLRTRLPDQPFTAVRVRVRFFELRTFWPSGGTSKIGSFICSNWCFHSRIKLSQMSYETAEIGRIGSTTESLKILGKIWW